MIEGFLDERGLYYRASALRPGLPTLVFIHGLSGSSSAWLPYEAALEAGHNIVSLDLRGHGRSRKSRRYHDYNVELIAGDVNALLDSLHVGPHVLVAHSFGTLVALAVLRSSSRATAAVFLSPTYDFTAVWWMPIARFLCILGWLFGRLAPFPTRPRGHVDYQSLRPTNDLSLRRIIPDLRNTGLRVYAYCLRHMYTRDVDAWWKDVRVPSLIVHGRQDAVVSWRHAALLPALVRHSRLVFVEDGNHVFIINDVPRVTAMIESFATAHAGSVAGEGAANENVEPARSARQ